MKKQSPIATWALGLSALAPILIIMGMIGAHTGGIRFDVAWSLRARPWRARGTTS
jgi:hypothetical protein